MTRRMKIGLGVTGGLLALIVVVVGAGIYIAQSDWLREKVRLKIISTAEDATGGRVEIGKFRFDWHTLTAQLDDVVIHGTEPANVPPLLRARSVVVGLKIISLWKRDFDIALLKIDTPQTYLTISTDGRTNIPAPKVASKSDKSGPETILDLKIKEFALQNGRAEVHAAGTDPKVNSYDATGQNLQSRFVYETAGPDYKGTLSIQPLELRYGPNGPVPVNVNLDLLMEKNRLRVNSAKLDTKESHVELSGLLDNFTTPVITAQYNGTFSVEEIGRILNLKSRQSGTVQLGGDARYASATDYLVTGNLHAKEVAYRQPGLTLTNVRADSALSVDPHKIALNGLRVAALGGTLAGRAEIRDFDEYRAEGKLEGFDIRRLASLATREQLPYDGLVGGTFSAAGRLTDKRNQNTVASARLAISPAGSGRAVQGLVDAKYDGRRDTVAFAPSFVALPATRLDFSGTLGQQLKIHLESRNLDDLLPLLAAGGSAAPKVMPVSLQQNTSAQGSVIFDGAVTGKLASPQITGHLDGRNFLYSGQLITAVKADISAQSTGASIQNGSVFYQNIPATLQGSVGLRNWKPDNDQRLVASASVQNAPIPALLALAGQKSIPITGTLSATAQANGTIGNPQAAANVTVVNGSAYEEPFDRLTSRINYLNGGTQTADVQLQAGPKQITLKADYQHTPADFLAGRLRFELASNRMSLNQFQTARKKNPGLDANVQFSASGDVRISQVKTAPNKPAETTFDLSNLNADASANAISMNGQNFGDAKLTAKTQGQTVTAHVESNVAGADIRGDGSWQLTGDYPGRGQVTFAKIDVGRVVQLVSPPKQPQTMNVNGSVEGKLSFDGPAKKPLLMNAVLEIPRLEVRPATAAGVVTRLPDLTIHNTAPIRITLANQVVNVGSARLVANNTDVTLGGTVDLKQKNPLNLQAGGTIDLALLRTFNPDVTSSGTVVANATVRGSFQQPQLGGRLTLQNGNFSMAGVPNGLFNTNGEIVFDGTRANIQKLTAESGGGKVNAGGFVAFGGPIMTFRVNVTGTSIRMRYPEGVSTVSNADLALTGTSERSVLSGDVTILRTGFNPRSDLGSLLSGSGGPTPIQTAKTGLVGGIQFDVHIQTSPDVSFQTGLVQELQAEANLRLRGNVDNPVLLGRILVTQGGLTFFGNKYVINEGTISFYNPVKLEPILNIDLETKAKGVDVTLTVSGPINKLNVTYRSDPPLQFADIVALLATGKTPSDANIAARQPTPASQSWEQLGASALVGQAIANPVAGRLQRFLGVSKLKIDPLLPGLGGGGNSSGGGSPGARLSLEQQVTPNITFDYVVNTNSTSSQVVRVEWAFNKNWSAVLLREENSAFGIDFQYKKRFK